MWFQQPDAFNLSSFVWNVAQNTSKSGLSDRIYIRLECVSEHLHMVFSGSDSYPIRKNSWSDQVQIDP